MHECIATDLRLTDLDLEYSEKKKIVWSKERQVLIIIINFKQPKVIPENKIQSYTKLINALLLDNIYYHKTFFDS